MLADHSLAEVVAPPLDGEIALAVDPAQGQAGVVLRLAPGARQRPGAGCVMPVRHVVAEGGVGALLVELRPVGVKYRLGLEEVGKRAALEHILLQGPVEALLLSLGLGMEGTAMDGQDAQLHHPDLVGRVAGGVVPPRRAVVREDRLRQPVFLEHPQQAPLHAGPALVVVGVQTQEPPGVVV